MSNDNIKPEVSDLKKTREVITKGLELSRKNLSKSRNINVSLEWIDEDTINDELGGVTGRALSYKSVILSFNTSSDEWEPHLMATLIHEYAHTWLYEKKGNSSWKDYSEMWEFFLQDAHAMNFVESVDPSLPSPMKEKFSENEVSNLWPEIKQELDKEIDWESGLMYGDDKFPRWIGYKAAHIIGKTLKEKYSLNEFHKINEEEIIKTGDKIFQNEA